MACSSPVSGSRLGWARERAGQRAVEVGAGRRSRARRSSSTGSAAGLDDGQRAPGVPDHVGVGREVARAVARAAASRRQPKCSLGVGAAHVAVAVPLGLAVAEADAVHHAVADEPVVGGRVGRRPGSGRCAGSGRRARPGACPVTAQVGGGELLAHGAEVPGQVGVGSGRQVMRSSSACNRPFRIIVRLTCGASVKRHPSQRAVRVATGVEVSDAGAGGVRRAWPAPR